MSERAIARGPGAGELVSLAERAGMLGAVRCVFLAVVLLYAVFAPNDLVASETELAGVSLAYLSLLIVPWLLWHRSTNGAVLIIGGTLLVDGVFIAWAIYSTGGTESPLWFLVFAHVVAVTLLGSSRTGLKVTVWH
jgi:hypothetical protein